MPKKPFLKDNRTYISALVPSIVVILRAVGIEIPNDVANAVIVLASFAAVYFRSKA